jgi:hypothetical protein
MSSELHSGLPETEEKQVCVSCLALNDTAAHFCTKCGASLSSYASTGPFEHLSAEGNIYRQAAKRPQKLVVVLGVWFIFGMTALTGISLILIGWGQGFGYLVIGAFMFPVSVIMIWKTTRNYLARGKRNESHDA